MAFTLNANSLGSTLNLQQTLNSLYDNYQQGNILGVIADTAAVAASVATYELQVGASITSSGLSMAQAMDKLNNGTVEPKDVMAVSNAILGGLAALGVVIAAPEAVAGAATVALVVGAYSYLTGSDKANEIMKWISSDQFKNDLSKGFISFGFAFGNAINGLEQSIADLMAKFQQSQKIVSPIVLDLNGDGIATTGLDSGTYFDHNANGFAENTGWVNAQDGILVRDLNGNGTIDSGRELFGSETLLANGQHAANGYTALAELDTNQDGQINTQDASAASLKIWKDTNGDGFSSADELMTLAAAGVQSIATGSTAANQTDANGNIIKQTGTYTKADGSTGTSADIWFAVNTANTIATDWLPETAAVAALPDLQGYGNVRDLHQAILRDSTGHLQDLVQQFVNATDLATRHSLIDQIIYAWVGVENVAPGSRGFIGDARQLYVLEAFMGESYTQGYGYNAGTPNTGWNAASYLTGIYKDLSSSLYSQLMAQTHLKPVLDSIGVTWNAASNQFDWDLTNTLTLLQDRYTNGDPSNSIGELGGVLKLNGDSGAQVLNALRAQGDAANDGVFEMRRVG